MSLCITPRSLDSIKIEANELCMHMLLSLSSDANHCHLQAATNIDDGPDKKFSNFY
jgi:murein endopeptidase